MNVYNRPLERCSRPGNAVTGYDRSGICGVLYNDRGSHHVCSKVKLEDGSSFCVVTGQPNWCIEEGPCDEDQSQMCPRDKWCVCQWAFARAVENVGCENVAVDCNATAMAALEAYEQDKRYASAARCLRKKCGL